MELVLRHMALVISEMVVRDNLVVECGQLSSNVSLNDLELLKALLKCRQLMSLWRSRVSDETSMGYRLADLRLSRRHVNGRRGWVKGLLGGLRGCMRVRSQGMLNC